MLGCSAVRRSSALVGSLSEAVRSLQTREGAEEGSSQLPLSPSSRPVRVGLAVPSSPLLTCVGTCSAVLESEWVQGWSSSRQSGDRCRWSAPALVAAAAGRFRLLRPLQPRAFVRPARLDILRRPSAERDQQSSARSRLQLTDERALGPNADHRPWPLIRAVRGWDSAVPYKQGQQRSRCGQQ